MKRKWLERGHLRGQIVIGSEIPPLERRQRVASWQLTLHVQGTHQRYAWAHGITSNSRSAQPTGNKRRNRFSPQFRITERSSRVSHRPSLGPKPEQSPKNSSPRSKLTFPPPSKNFTPSRLPPMSPSKIFSC